MKKSKNDLVLFTIQLQFSVSVFYAFRKPSIGYHQPSSHLPHKEIFMTCKLQSDQSSDDDGDVDCPLAALQHW